MAYYEEKVARRLIVRAGRELLAAGLTARTWGNISARVSAARFVITPSGLPYEALRPEQLVLMDLDGHVCGGGKPSSEKGIHADAYRLHPSVNFIIHTHQDNASAVSITGRALVSAALPGGRAPCAAYGMPSTGRLRRAVAAEMARWPECSAILLCRHGALCLGSTMEEAFFIARTLEDTCGDYLWERAAPPSRSRITDLGSSQRRGDAFWLTRSGRQQSYAVASRRHPPAAALHAAVYQSGHVHFIAHETSPEVVWASRQERTLRPMLDDLAQIAGTDIRCAGASPGQAALALRGRGAVLLRGAGALCAAATEDDLAAVRAILRKGCKAWLLADALPECRPLGRLDALIQRTIYVQKYAKKSRLW